MKFHAVSRFKKQLLPFRYIYNRQYTQLPLFVNMLANKSRSAIKLTKLNSTETLDENLKNISFSHKDYTYDELLKQASLLSKRIRAASDSARTNLKCMAIVVDDQFNFTKSLIAVWMLNGIAVPLNSISPKSEILARLGDSDSNIVVTDKKSFFQDEEFKKIEIHNINNENDAVNISVELPEVPMHNPAVIIFTSGTTGKPKGVVLTHENLTTQMRVLCKAWKWSSDDTSLHALPLYHVHGLLNALLCPLWCGARVDFLPFFHPSLFYAKLLDKREESFTVFTGVPTMYAKIIQLYETLSAAEKEKIRKESRSKIRLLMSGSAALSPHHFHKIEEITGQRVLERYGMTETGMILSNTLMDKRPGSVGLPMETVEIKLKEEGDNMYKLLVKGPSVFKEYVQSSPRHEALDITDFLVKLLKHLMMTDEDVVSLQDNQFVIKGRNSDIIKFGGYKISCLELEGCILGYENVRECAVTGIPDEVYGEIIAAIIVPKDYSNFQEDKLIEFLKSKISNYKIPKVMKISQEAIPRNHMGKIDKKQVKNILSTK